MLPEHKIQLALLNDRFETSDIENLGQERWDFFISEADRHRIAPLLFSKIKLAGAESSFPADIARKLREKYLASAYRNTILFHQLIELLARLNHKGIPVILLKGAHLGEFVYRDISLRPMSDLDIFVREEHLSEAVKIAFGAGYRFFSDNNPQNEKTGAKYDYGIIPDFKHFQALIHSETQCMLEIHCFIASEKSPFKIPPSELWQNALPAALNEIPVLILSPEDLIIHLCMHAAYDHLFDFGLGALYDIAITIKHYGKSINWHEIRRRSGQWRTERCLLLALYFTKEWMGAEIPDQMLEGFRIDNIVHIAEERIFKTTESAPLHQHYIHWRNLKGICAKIHYIGEVLFPPRRFMENRYLKPRDSRVLFGSYFFRFYQSLKGVCGIVKNMLNDGQYMSRVKQGENDFLLREWLIKSLE